MKIIVILTIYTLFNSEPEIRKSCIETVIGPRSELSCPKGSQICAAIIKSGKFIYGSAEKDFYYQIIRPLHSREMSISRESLKGLNENNCGKVEVAARGLFCIMVKKKCKESYVLFKAVRKS